MGSILKLIFLALLTSNLIEAESLSKLVPPPASTFPSTIRTFYSDTEGAFHSKFFQDNDGSCTVLEMGWVNKFRGFDDPSPEALFITRRAALQPMADTKLGPVGNSKIVEIYGRQEDNVRHQVDLHCKTKAVLPVGGHPVANEEVRKVIDSGDQKNRVDVVFMGDGYQLAEKDEFFSDIDRLVNDMFEGTTFRSYLPLFNVWAIFVPSVDSGIGYNGPKNTPFQLYRESGQLRGIYPGNAAAARTTCTLTGSNGCDYPSIIANDDYYGGLGGEFVISTRSNRTGTVVLRHEMGHNFVNVGEEYDEGQVYRGVNSASSVNGLGWGHWLSGVKREERAIYRLKEYPWHDLSQGSQSLTFTSDGSYARWFMEVSVSAAGEADSLEFTLDGEILEWTSTGFDDREFYRWSGNEGFSSGSHTFTVRSKTASNNPNIPRMICSVRLHEFGDEDEFNMSNDYISAYPTWDVYNRKTFRPTNAGCLMRNMTHNMLCHVCREGMWYEFFRKVSLIDNVTVDNSGSPGAPKQVTLNTLQLAQFRPPGNEVEGEELRVHWFLNNVEQEGLLDETEILAATGSWRVDVVFVTPEVRSDPSALLRDTASFTV